MSSIELPDFAHDTPPRAMGSETEFTVQLDMLPDLDKVQSIKPYTVHSSRMSDEAWLTTGGRLYYDMYNVSDPSRQIAEYCTPECITAQEVMIHEKVGEQIILDLAQEVAPTAGFPLFKRSAYCDVRGRNGQLIMEATSIGHHENYTTSLDGYDVYASNTITSYLTTRHIWAGAGMVTPNGYALAQKTTDIMFDHDPSLDRYKIPYYSAADRLEIRSGDGNMSPWAIRTKFAMTSLVLRLVEHEKFPELAMFSDDSQMQFAAESSARDPYAAVWSEGNAITHQAAIAEAAYDFAEAHEVPNEERQAAADILTITRTLQESKSLRDAAASLDDRVDWAARLNWLHQNISTRSIASLGLTSTNLCAVQYDLLWDAVGEDAPSSRQYRQTPYLPTDRQLRRALHHPPHTRASSRTKFLRKQASQSGDTQIRVFWHEVTVNGVTRAYPSPYLV